MSRELEYRRVRTVGSESPRHQSQLRAVFTWIARTILSQGSRFDRVRTRMERFVFWTAARHHLAR